MITSAQVRAARALLNWSAEELAQRAGLHRATVQRMERRDGPVRGHTASLDAIMNTFAAQGVEFILDNNATGVIQKYDVDTLNRT